MSRKGASRQIAATPTAAKEAGDSTNAAPQTASGLAGDMRDWFRSLSVVVSSGGIAAVVVFILWQRRRARHWENRLAQTNQELNETAKRLGESARLVEKLQMERGKLDVELRKTASEIEKRVVERTTDLAKGKAALQAELDARRSAERLLAQQTKELERSKDVLELHVQARTQELQKLQRRYESILNSAGEGIYGLDLQGRVTFANPAASKLSGWKVEEIIAKSEQEVFQFGGAGELSEGNAFKVDADGNHLAEQIFICKNGVPFPVEYIRTPIKENDKLIGAVVMFKDITERKRAEDALSRKAAELARSNAELEQFAYVASHDLQEPLRKIQAFGDRLKTKCDAVNLTDGRDYLERMQSASARMQTLINDLLTFSRVISASQPFVPVDLNVVVKGVLSDLEVRIEQTKAIVEVGQLPTIEADPMQMRQLLQNLIGNALKFQPADAQPLVKITGRILKEPFGPASEGEIGTESCEIAIQDNGIGFDEQYVEKIFAVFQRLHGRNEYEGTGVGLAVCRRIADRHGGSIIAKSKPGQGATFIINLPVKHAKTEVAP